MFNVGDIIIEGHDIITIAIITDIADMYSVKVVEIWKTAPHVPNNFTQFECDEKGLSDFKSANDSKDKVFIIETLFGRISHGKWK
jgi:hypothetical protein